MSDSDLSLGQDLDLEQEGGWGLMLGLSVEAVIFHGFLADSCSVP